MYHENYPDDESVLLVESRKAESEQKLENFKTNLYEVMCSRVSNSILRQNLELTSRTQSEMYLLKSKICKQLGVLNAIQYILFGNVVSSEQFFLVPSEGNLFFWGIKPCYISLESEMDSSDIKFLGNRKEELLFRNTRNIVSGLTTHLLFKDTLSSLETTFNAILENVEILQVLQY